MGLLYVLPISEEETDRLEINPTSGRLVLKSYGLPLIFWGYLLGILTIILAMGLAISSPLRTLYQTQDPLNQILVLACLGTLTIIPLGFLSFLFYEYRVEKLKDQLVLKHLLFWIPIWSKKIVLQNAGQDIWIEHFMDSPNMAKLYGDEDMRGFQNKGHFLLKAKALSNTIHIIDRSSKKADLVKLKDLLGRY